LDNLAKEDDDPLKVLIRDLGNVPNISRFNRKDIQLDLVNAFSANFVNKQHETISAYHEVKQLILEVLEEIPETASPQTLNEMLQFAKEHMSGREAQKMAIRAEALLVKLVEGNYKDFTHENAGAMIMREIAADAANQELVKENQLKEIDRLKAALRNLKKHGQFTSEQISEFNRYLDDTRRKASENSLIGDKPFKYTYKALEKKRYHSIKYCPIIFDQQNEILYFDGGCRIVFN